jgi:hypothetical protein
MTTEDIEAEFDAAGVKVVDFDAYAKWIVHNVAKFAWGINEAELQAADPADVEKLLHHCRRIAALRNN